MTQRYRLGKRASSESPQTVAGKSIADARRRGVDLMAEMSDWDWAEYRAQCRSWLETEAGQAHKQRALRRIAAKRAVVDEAS